jgi:hypothetical protein
MLLRHAWLSRQEQQEEQEEQEEEEQEEQQEEQHQWLSHGSSQDDEQISARATSFLPVRLEESNNFNVSNLDTYELDEDDCEEEEGMFTPLERSPLMLSSNGIPETPRSPTPLTPVPTLDLTPVAERTQAQMSDPKESRSLAQKNFLKNAAKLGKKCIFFFFTIYSLGLFIIDPFDIINTRRLLRLF